MKQLSFKFMEKIIEEESKSKMEYLKTIPIGDGMYAVQDVYSQVDKGYFASSPLGIINAKNKV